MNNYNICIDIKTLLYDYKYMQIQLKWNDGKTSLFTDFNYIINIKFEL